MIDYGQTITELESDIPGQVVYEIRDHRQHRMDHLLIIVLAVCFMVVLVSGGYLLYAEHMRAEYYKLLYEDAALIVHQQSGGHN